jgi:hypothetical protein
VPGISPGETPGARGAGDRVGVSKMCKPVKLSKLVNQISIINSPIERNKRAKLIEIVSSTCHEKLDNKFRIKTINDLLKKQKPKSSAFVMYIDIQYDEKRDLIIFDYPFYPLLKKEVSPK